ncbi:helix-turn-helix transcriptional regulator [Aneurinibacillus terranovensis]|uniref:helix-turn-helix transcriptional regulator n=1 Tax=Aneurinibacillus terranovensis TaxID=278991 RepID=UPI0003F7629A|nr:hypothetical protein [Aneurinibacillus terranovensis]
MQYKVKINEIDDGTDYPILTLSGLTGLGQDTIERLVQEGKFPVQVKDGVKTVNGKKFRQWSHSVHDMVEVEKNDYPTMKVNEH